MGDEVGSGSGAATQVAGAHIQYDDIQSVGSRSAAEAHVQYNAIPGVGSGSAAGAHVPYDAIHGGRAGSQTGDAPPVATDVTPGHSLDHPQSKLQTGGGNTDISPAEHTRQINEATLADLAGTRQIRRPPSCRN